MRSIRVQNFFSPRLALTPPISRTGRLAKYLPNRKKRHPSRRKKKLLVQLLEKVTNLAKKCPAKSRSIARI